MSADARIAAWRAKKAQPNGNSCSTKSNNVLDQVRNGRHNNATKTHCPQAHLYTPNNTYTNTRGSRECRTCRKARR